MPVSQYDNLTYAAYKPISMQEMWAPAAEMRQQHDKLQEDYAQQELLGGAASLGLQEKVDDKAIATNNAYMGAVKAAADELATKGIIDSGRRRNLMALKQQYTKDVLPIQNALKERDAAVKFDREMKAKDDSYESSFDPSKIAVTDYIGNTSAFTTKGASKSVVAQDVAQQMSQLKEQIQSDMPQVTGRILNDVLMRYNVGASPDQVNFIIQEAARANGRRLDASQSTKLGAMMKSIINGTLDKHGVFDKFKDPAQVQRFVNAAAQSSIYALNGPKLDKAHDNLADAKDAAALAPPPAEGRGDYDYVPGFDEGKVEELGDLQSVIESNAKHSKSYSDQIASIAKGRPWTSIPESDKNAIKVLYKFKEVPGRSLWDIKSKLEAAGVKIPKNLERSGLDDPKLVEFLKQAVPAAQENYKSANKSILFRDLGDKEVDKIQSYIYANSKNLKNRAGEEVSFDDITANGQIIGAPKYILNKHGFNIALNKKDGGQEIVRGDINDLGSPTIARYYNGLMAVEQDKKSMGDTEFKSKYKMNKERLDLTPNYNALESDIRGRTNTYIGTVPIPGQ